MDRSQTKEQQIAILATGDELVYGDILNTNAQVMAEQLISHGIMVGLHIVAPDNIPAIRSAINYLLDRYMGLILIGGLGPTTDDITRFALSEALAIPLVFHEETWQAIVARLAKLGTASPPVANRQQALFPEGATVIANPQGTAPGCFIHDHHRCIFMLPGPPSECLPMFHHTVLPVLQKQNFVQEWHYRKWLLFGVSEGKIGQILDEIVQSYPCVTGYRLTYPYIEFKLFSTQGAPFSACVEQVLPVITPYLLGTGTEPASQQLLHWLETHNHPLTLCDQATAGLLQQTLTTPATHRYLHFTTEPSEKNIYIHGLEAYWSQQTFNTIATLSLHYPPSAAQTFDIPLRGERTLQYAVEFICHHLHQWLLQHS